MKKKSFIPLLNGMKLKIRTTLDLDSLAEDRNSKGVTTSNYKKPEFNAKYPFRIANDDYWTMIYNLGFAVNFQTVNMLFYNRFYRIDDADNEGVTNYNCSETLVGWYYYREMEYYGCVRAIKMGGLTYNQ